MNRFTFFTFMFQKKIVAQTMNMACTTNVCLFITSHIRLHEFHE